jgi:Integrase core domain
MGRGADRKRAAAEARPSGVAANDPEIYAEVSAGDGYTSGRPAVGDFSKESRSGDHRLRFLRRGDNHFWNSLRVRGNRACLTSTDSPHATAHPTAAWTLLQLRNAIPFDHEYRFIIHDHDAIFSAELDASLTRFGLKVITTPVRSPQANSLCERLIRTLRRECLDWIIPLSEGHLRRVLASWRSHYNRGRPHSALGPGIPDPRLADLRVKPCGHRLPVGHRVVATPILGGLHHEYSLQKLAA